jgi:hypothetical protein
MTNLGYGRGVLVSRKWSGKTLADHRGDRQAWRSRRSRAGQRRATMTARPGHLARSANGTLWHAGP